MYHRLKTRTLAFVLFTTLAIAAIPSASAGPFQDTCMSEPEELCQALDATAEAGCAWIAFIDRLGALGRRCGSLL